MRDKRKRSNGTRTLEDIAKDLIKVGSDISQIKFPQNTTASSFDIQVLPFKNTVNTIQNQSIKGSTANRNTSLMAFVSPTSEQFKGSSIGNNFVETTDWKEKLRELAKQMDDPSAIEQVELLIRRNESLSSAVEILERQADETMIDENVPDLLLKEQVEAQLELEEIEWEETMKKKEKVLIDVEEQLRGIQERKKELQEEYMSYDDDTMDTIKEQEEAERKAEIELKTLQTTLALRMEEKRDLDAAIDSMRMKAKQRISGIGLAQASTRDSLVSGSIDTIRNSTHRQELLDKLQALEEEKADINQAILMAEKERESLEDTQDGKLIALRADLATKKVEKMELTTELEYYRSKVERYKQKMKHMVDTQTPSSDSDSRKVNIEAIILQLLYQNEGEMEMADLKKETADLLQKFTTQMTSSSLIVRALYALVANGLVTIDRSNGNSLVTSLLV